MFMNRLNKTVLLLNNLIWSVDSTKLLFCYDLPGDEKTGYLFNYDSHLNLLETRLGIDSYVELNTFPPYTHLNKCLSQSAYQVYGLIQPILTAHYGEVMCCDGRRFGQPSSFDLVELVAAMSASGDLLRELIKKNIIKT